MMPENIKPIIGIALLLLIVLVYFVPSVVAKGKRNWQAIFVLNLFAGWTFVGWIVALVWACTKDTIKDRPGPDPHISKE